MLIDDYQAAAARTATSGSIRDIRHRVLEWLGLDIADVALGASRGNYRLLCGVLGLTGEAGELADKLKKEVFHGHAPDDDKLMEELGDVLWYVAEVASAKGWTLSSVASRNVQKLWRRYPDGFSCERSVNRV